MIPFLRTLLLIVTFACGVYVGALSTCPADYLPQGEQAP